MTLLIALIDFRNMKFKKLQAYFNYSREIFIWFLEVRLGFLCVLVLLLAFLTSFYTWPSEKTIRTSGYILQLLGMIFAIRGILKIREHFGQPALKCMFGSWIKKFPKWHKHGYFKMPPIHIGITVGEADLEVWAPDNQKDPIEKRLEAAFQNLNSLRENQRNHTDQISKIKKVHKEFKEDQIGKIESIQNKLSTELEQAHTSDILVSFVGLIWLTFGITLSTLPSEIFLLIK